MVTKYLVDDQNPTGYGQVILEDNTATGEKQYIYGLQLLSERYQASAGSPTFTIAFYGYDGHGRVRFLTDLTGAVTDTCDAFGDLVNKRWDLPVELIRGIRAESRAPRAGTASVSMGRS